MFFIWDGYTMVPPDKLLPALRRSLTAGNTYKLIVADERRSPEQNKKLWAMLTEVSQQATLRGHKFEPDEWKVIFLHGLGREIRFLPSLEGNTYVPYGHQSSKLSKEEMAELIEYIYAEGTKRGVVFKDDPINHERTG